MTLLDNPLIKKYFECPEYCNHYDPKIVEQHEWLLAYRVLQAMQEPIKMYEKALYTHDDGKTWQVGAITGVPFGENEFHPTWLRLPDKFQKPEKKECKHLEARARGGDPTSYFWCSTCEEKVLTTVVINNLLEEMRAALRLARETK